MIRYLLIFIALLSITSCEDTNIAMITGAASDAVQAITLTDEQVKKISSKAAQAADSKHRVAGPGDPYTKRLKRLVASLRNRDNNTFNYKVYLTDTVNAFAMADGTIRVNSGLMDIMNDQELLFVIGHEMGHVVEEHSRKKVVMAYATSALRKAVASQNNEAGQVAASILGAFAEQLANAQFSQHEELQADRYGAAFLKDLGYDNSAAVSALNKLAELARNHTFLSSHPNPQARAERIARGIPEEVEDEDSTFKKLFEVAKALLVKSFELLLWVVNWLLSFLK